MDLAEIPGFIKEVPVYILVVFQGVPEHLEENSGVWVLECI